MPKSKFKVGDRVRVVKRFIPFGMGPLSRAVGVIKFLHGYCESVGVEMEKAFEGHHTSEGLLWWFPADGYLEKIPKKEKQNER